MLEDLLEAARDDPEGYEGELEGEDDALEGELEDEDGAVKHGAAGRTTPGENSDEDADDDEDPPLAKRRRVSPREASVETGLALHGPRLARRVVKSGRPMVSHFEPHARHIFNTAIPIFKSYVSSIDAYPDKVKEMAWAKKAWDEAAARHSVPLAATEDCIAIVRDPFVCYLSVLPSRRIPNALRVGSAS